MRALKVIWFALLLTSASLAPVAGCASSGERFVGPTERWEAGESERQAKRESEEADRRRKIEARTDWEPELRQLLLDRKIRIGLTSEQVELSWGQPRKKNRTVTKYGASEQWVYWYEPDTTYVYIDDGVLTSWQDSE